MAGRGRSRRRNPEKGAGEGPGSESDNGRPDKKVLKSNLAEGGDVLSQPSTSSSCLRAQLKSGGDYLLPPLRKNVGKNGREIKLRANHFPVTFNLDSKIHHYDVVIKPEMKANKKLKRQIIVNLVESNPRVFGHVKCVFDGEKNLFSNDEIRIGREVNFEVILDGNEKDSNREFTVIMKKVAQIYLRDLDRFLKGFDREVPQNAIQALDIVFRYLPTLSFVSIGRSLFPDQTHGTDLGGGVEMWRGYYQSLRPGKWKENLQLNVDVSNRAFYKGQSLLDFAAEFHRGTREDLARVLPARWEEFSKNLKGLRVEVVHTRPRVRRYRLCGKLGKPASLLTFPMDKDGRKVECTVAKYFLETYNYRLRYGNLPCVQAQPDTKNTFLPIEVCEIVGGQQVKKLSDIQTSKMIRDTAIPAPERQEKITSLIREANLNQDPYVQAFGISVSDQMVRFTGRVLNAPLIEVGYQQSVIPRDGVWDFSRKSFFQPSSIDDWGVISADKYMRTQECDKFIIELQNIGRELGMSIRNPLFKEQVNDNNLMDSFMKMLSRFKSIQLIVVVLPKFSSLYGEVKRIGDIKLGLMTQCILGETIQRKCNRATLINILMKLNAKFDQVSSILASNQHVYARSFVFREAVIFLGADVTHPGAGEMKKPSIAAVVGSLDKNAQIYAAKISVQQHRQEIIKNLKEQVKDLLRLFHRSTRAKPLRIIFYRDGVGEGQFTEVLRHELLAIRAACTSLESDYQPAITFLVVQKRHHTRLFCEDSRDSIGKSRNVPPGTIVDTTIVHPTENDFFLCSHQGIQGTSRPAHYHVLHDDSDFKADDLHQLTYELCHTYVRCPRSVSIPSPAYYAHHAALRARAHLEPLQKGLEQSGRELNDIILNMQDAVKVHDNTGSMYFV